MPAWARKQRLQQLIPTEEAGDVFEVQRVCGASDDDLKRVGKRLTPLGSCQAIRSCGPCYSETIAFVHKCLWGTGSGCTGAGGIQCWQVGGAPSSCHDNCCISDSSLSGCLYKEGSSCSTAHIC